jgi:hypothetical protein
MRPFIVGLLVILALLLAAPAEAARWAGPELTNPTAVTVPTSGLSRSFGATEDVILDLPDAPVTGEIALNGGDDIRIVGGQIGGGLTFTGTNGIVARKVFIQNSRILGSKFSGGAVHPDLFQKQGALGSVYVDHVTGESSYQGFQVASQSFSSGCSNGSQERYTEGLKDGDRTKPGEMVVSSTNLRHRADQQSGYLAWLTWDAGSNGSFSGEDPFPVRLEDFWVRGRPQGDRTVCCNLLWPRTSTPTAEDGADVRMVLSADRLSATWRPEAQITGTAYQGDPPTGDFSPAGVAGLTYSAEPPPRPAYAPACAPDCDETIVGLRADVAELTALIDRARGAWADLSGALNP